MSNAPLLDVLRRHVAAGRLGDPVDHLIQLYAKTPADEIILRALAEQIATQAVKRHRHGMSLTRTLVNAIGGPAATTPRGLR